MVVECINLDLIYNLQGGGGTIFVVLSDVEVVSWMMVFQWIRNMEYSNILLLIFNIFKLKTHGGFWANYYVNK